MYNIGIEVYGENLSYRSAIPKLGYYLELGYRYDRGVTAFLQVLKIRQEETNLGKFCFRLQKVIFYLIQ